MARVILVSCVGQKKFAATTAAELYTSSWFIKARGFARREADKWFILSARHGLLDPGQIIEPYEATLKILTKAERLTWAKGVTEQLAPKLLSGDEVVILAGQFYYEHLVKLLREGGFKAETPLAHLGIGQQLAWFDARQSESQ